MQKILIISLKTISSQSFEEAGGRIFDIAKFLSKKIIVKLMKKNRYPTKENFFKQLSKILN